MSEMERNKGKLIPTGIDTSDFSEDDFDTYCENGFLEVDGEIYEVKWEVRRDSDGVEFADVQVNEDGSIDFHTYHYNGSMYWTEVVAEHMYEKS